MISQPIDPRTQLYQACLVRLRQLENSIAVLQAKRRWTTWLVFFGNKRRLNAELKRLFAEQQQVQIQMVGLNPTNNPLVCLDTRDNE